MQSVIQDIRYGIRTLAKRPGFSLVAVFTLALGIAANTAIFSVINTVLLKPLPFPESQQLVDLSETFKPNGFGSVSVPNLEDWRAQSDVFTGIAAYYFTSFNLQGSDSPQRISGLTVSPNYFEVLGVRPVLGRGFVAGEDKPGSNRVVVLSDQVWRSNFGGDPNVIGSVVPINGEKYNVIGVMPPHLTSLYRAVQLWSPLVFSDNDRTNRETHKFQVLGRIKSGIQLEQAREQMNTIAQRLEQQYSNGRGVRVMRLEELRVASVRPALMVMMVAVGFVLLIACTNVANLLLARATVRYREIGIRIALGAGRLRLMRQFLTEGLLLSLVGGAIGVGLAWWGLKMLGTIAFPFLPRSQEIAIDARVLIFTVLISVVTSVIFGLAPSLQSAKTDLVEALKEGGNNSSVGSIGTWLRQSLVVAEVASAFVLLIGAGLLIRSFARLQEVQPGFDPNNVLSAKMSLPRDKYPNVESAIRFHEQAVQRISQVPGVDAVGLVSHLPVEEQGYNGNISVEGKTYPKNESPLVEFRVVSPDFFRAAGIPLLKGRLLNDHDAIESAPVVVINNAMAQQIWPGEDPLGKRILEDPKATVVGVVGDVKNYGLTRQTAGEMYIPYKLKDAWPDMLWNMRLVVRSRVDDASLAAALRREIQTIDPSQPLYAVQPMHLVLQNTVSDRKLNMTLLLVFAVIALLLAIIGVYGVMSYTVAQNTREIGIRVALGARPATILKLVLGRGIILIGIGVVIGVIAALGLTRFLGAMLFGVTPTDPVTFVLIGLVLTAIGLAACLIPARRAMKVDPLIALRYE
jgi:putative ABC transport system permease protein